ncbi:hypothetical protein LCGC14_2413740, partial [marine sediment metagenome]
VFPHSIRSAKFYSKVSSKNVRPLRRRGQSIKINVDKFPTKIKSKSEIERKKKMSRMVPDTDIPVSQAHVLDMKMRNPKTGRMIKIKTGLQYGGRYGINHPVYRAAKAAIKSYG